MKEKKCMEGNIFPYYILSSLLIIMPNKQQKSSAEIYQKKEQRRGKDTIFNDIEYSITTTLMRKQYEGLFQREIASMIKSNSLIDTFMNFKRRNHQITLDSNTQHSILHAFEPKFQRKQIDRKLLSRKSPKINPIEFSVEKCLNQIQENCQKKIYDNVCNLVSEVKRLRRCLTNLQMKERKYESKNTWFERVQAENFILQKKLNEVTAQISYKNEKILELEQKLKEVSQFQIQKQQSTPELNSKVVTLLRQYINDKEKAIQNKESRLNLIQRNIESIFENSISEQNCSKCCSFLKKIKNSVLEYKSYLQQEEKYMNDIFEKYKNNLLKGR